MRGSSWPLAPGVLGAVLTAAMLACGERSAGDARPGTRAPADYVGLRTPPLPEGLEQVGGALLELGVDTVFAISHVQRDTLEMLWLERELGQEGAESRFQVEDVLRLPPIGPEGVLVYAVCRLNERPDPEIVAIVSADDEAEILTQVHAAWRADRQQRRFVELPVTGIDCVNEGYGA